MLSKGVFEYAEYRPDCRAKICRGMPSEMTTDYDFEVQNQKNEICTGAKLKNGVLHLRNEIVILS